MPGWRDETLTRINFARGIVEVGILIAMLGVAWNRLGGLEHRMDRVQEELTLIRQQDGRIQVLYSLYDERGERLRDLEQRLRDVETLKRER